MIASDLVRFAAELPALLRRLLQSPEELAAVAARSYVHDNGFVKIVLESGENGDGALRLHIWPSEAGADGNIHNHCWDFTSFVLTGTLEYEEFVNDDAGALLAEHFAYAPTDDFHYELRSRGMQSLRPTRSGVREAGDVYEMSGETLHWTCGRHGTTTVTLLAQGAHRREYADVYVTRLDVPTRAHNTPLTADTLRIQLQAVMKAF
jgi:hypothetical protein